jgi:hypothetical protein
LLYVSLHSERILWLPVVHSLRLQTEKPIIYRVASGIGAFLVIVYRYVFFPIIPCVGRSALGPEWLEEFCCARAKLHGGGASIVLVQNTRPDCTEQGRLGIQPEIVLIHDGSARNLSEIADAVDLFGFEFGLRERGQQQRGEDGDDGNNDEQFN